MATVVSVRNGKRQVHDGPYAETKEFLGGFVILDVPNLDAALEWAARHPAPAEWVQSKCARWAASYSAAGRNTPLLSPPHPYSERGKQPIMNPGTKRSIFRWIHIIFSIPIFGYIYSPSEKFHTTRPVFGLSSFL